MMLTKEKFDKLREDRDTYKESAAYWYKLCQMQIKITDIIAEKLHKLECGQESKKKVDMGSTDEELAS